MFTFITKSRFSQHHNVESLGTLFTNLNMILYNLQIQVLLRTLIYFTNIQYLNHFYVSDIPENAFNVAVNLVNYFDVLNELLETYAFDFPLL